MDSNERPDEVSLIARATQMREIAQDRIVRAFRSQIEGRGFGPTDSDLQSFVRFALVEATLRKSCLTGSPACAEPQPDALPR